MYLTHTMKYIRIRPGYITIHVSTPSHMARPVRLWDTLGYTGIQQDTSTRAYPLGYNGIQQDTSARAYPHRLHMMPPDTAGIRRRSRIRVVFSSLLPLYLPCCPRASKRSSSSSLESGAATRARSRAGRHISLSGCVKSSMSSLSSTRDSTTFAPFLALFISFLELCSCPRVGTPVEEIRTRRRIHCILYSYVVYSCQLAYVSCRSG